MTGLERVGENLAIAGCMSYAYDGAGQLVSYRRGQNTETYGYDLLGNRTFRTTNGADGAVYQYNALNQLVSLSENGKQYAYEYDKRGNLIQESLDGAAVRQYTYNAANRMTLGKNLETGEETRYDYNALYMRIKNVQTLAGQEPSEEFLTKETSYVPDYLSITNNDLMACEKDADAASTIFGQGHERLMRKTATGKVYFQPDLYGSILSVSDGQGQNLGYSEWDVWGDVEFHGQGNQPRPEGGAVPGFTSYIPDPVIGKHFAQARFYDPAHGRMLAPDPVKRGLNGYPYCGNDPVNYVDPTGEVANILAGGILGGIMGGTFGFAGSAITQIVGGKEFDVREALGAGASGMVVGAVRGALVGSGAGLPVALVSDFTAGTVGSTLEQLITGGKADAGKSIAGGLANAVSGAIYGNNPLGSLKEAFGRGAAAGAATSGINYLSEVFGGQKEERRSGTLRGSLGLVPFGRANDPRRGCMARDPFGGMTEGGSDYGYQYQIPRRERTVRKAPERFSLAEFAKEVVTGFVMGGLSSAAFYGAGRAVEAVKSSIQRVYEGGLYSIGDAAFMDSDDTFLKYIQNRTDVDVNGYYDIIAHGTPNGIQITHNGQHMIVDHRTAARLIQNTDGYNGQGIRLLSCNTGALDNGFAQNLANQLNVEVYAPTNYLWAKKDGNYFVAGMKQQGGPNMSELGMFRLFIPGGNQ